MYIQGLIWYSITKEVKKNWIIFRLENEKRKGMKWSMKWVRVRVDDVPERNEEKRQRRKIGEKTTENARKWSENDVWRMEEENSVK